MTVRSELLAKVLDREVPREISIHLDGRNGTSHFEGHDDAELDELSNALYLDYLSGLRQNKEGYVLVGDVGYFGQKPFFSTRTGTQNMGSAIVFDYDDGSHHLNDIVANSPRLSRLHQKHKYHSMGDGAVEDEIAEDGATMIRYEDVEALAMQDVDPHYFEGDESAIGARLVLSNRLSPEMRKVYRHINRNIGKELN